MMIRNTAILKRVLTSKINHLKALRSRSYHASAALPDALDMTDTFARRHSKYNVDVMLTSRTTNSVQIVRRDTQHDDEKNLRRFNDVVVDDDPWYTNTHTHTHTHTHTQLIYDLFLLFHYFVNQMNCYSVQWDRDCKNRRRCYRPLGLKHSKILSNRPYQKILWPTNHYNLRTPCPSPRPCFKFVNLLTRIR
jgi:hypothetical protein